MRSYTRDQNRRLQLSAMNSEIIQQYENSIRQALSKRKEGKTAEFQKWVQAPGKDGNSKHEKFSSCVDKMQDWISATYHQEAN
jgi:hypothetical protein